MLVALRDETLGYGERSVLSNITVGIDAGERVALLGRSGAGKSTLLTQLHDRLAQSQPVVALVPQDEALVPALCVYHNIYMGRLDRHHALYNIGNLIWPRACDVREAGDVAQTVGLAESLWQPAAQLSGGQRQRTAIARALYRGGPIVLADEPVSAVDATQGGAILATLVDRFETVILAMHDVALARRFATRLIGLKCGRIVFDDATAAIGTEQILALYAD